MMKAKLWKLQSQTNNIYLIIYLYLIYNICVCLFTTKAGHCFKYGHGKGVLLDAQIIVKIINL